ncbi:hypothetical protein ACLKA6_000754 [Drosophila palustris]
MKCCFIITLIIFSILKDTRAVPVSRLETDPELIAGFFEGDMIMESHKRNGLQSETYRWPDRTVFYHFSSDIDQEHRNHILLAMYHIELNSCLVFKEVTEDQPYYVNITSSPGGCYTAVGFLNKVQLLNLETYPLDTGCYRLGSIMHEILHTLGFYHQQSTWDRDEHVRIATENILEGKEHNFEKYEKDLVDNFDQDYDYASIMHYTPYGFSKNGEMTIVPFEAGAEKVMGQRMQLSEKDVNKLNIMYKCPRHV